MKRILLTTTSLILAAGVAHSEVTFSGKGEVGVNRAPASAEVIAVAGVETVSGAATATAAGIALATGATTAATTTVTAADAASVAAALAALNAAKVVTINAAAAVRVAPTRAALDTAQDALVAAQASEARALAAHAANVGTVAAAKGTAGDMTVYSGYDLNVAVSGATDNGTTFSMGFDMGAGELADRDDDREMDTQGTAIGISALTIGNNGITYEIGQDKIDDLYDDSQNGDVGISGNMGSIAFSIVADLEKDTAATAASSVFTAAAANPARTGNTSGVSLANGNAAGAANRLAPVVGDSDYVGASFVETAATAAVHESTSLKVSGTAGAAAWSFITTNKNDTGDAASAVNLSFAASDALSFAINHDTKGKSASINKLSATYVMDALTLSISAADDKDANGGKASRNMSIGYAAGPMAATFATDEVSAWSVVGQYDLGGGAQAFATIDHTEFAVLGLSFAF